MTRLAAILTCLALAGCGTTPAVTAQAVDPGDEVTLAAGATVSVKTANLQVHFVSVTEDSRCPRDVTCVWAGEVKVLLGIQTPQVASQVEILEGGNTVAGAHRVTLIRVEPQPMSTAKIAPHDYRATLKRDKVG